MIVGVRSELRKLITVTPTYSPGGKIVAVILIVLFVALGIYFYKHVMNAKT